MSITIEGCVTLIPCDGVSMTIKQRLLEASIPGWQALVGSRIQLNGIFGSSAWYVDSVIDSNNPAFDIACAMSALAPSLTSITILGPGACGEEITSTNCCAIIVSCTTGQTLNVALGEENSTDYNNWDNLVGHLITIDDVNYPGDWQVDGICCMNIGDGCDNNSECALGGVSIPFGDVSDEGTGACTFNGYKITNCQTKVSYNTDPETSTNLFAYLGSVITIEEETGCWTVVGPSERVLDNITATLIAGYDDCLCCLGPEPVKYTRVIPKPDRKFYQVTQGQCDINANVKFAEGYYRLFKTLKHGIANACDNINLNKLWIKKNLSDLAVLNDPTACVTPEPVVPIICPEPKGNPYVPPETVMYYYTVFSPFTCNGVCLSGTPTGSSCLPFFLELDYDLFTSIPILDVTFFGFNYNGAQVWAYAPFITPCEPINAPCTSGSYPTVTGITSSNISYTNIPAVEGVNPCLALFGG